MILQQVVQSEKTREIYWGLNHTAHVVWFVVSYGAVLIFLVGCAGLYMKYRQGRGPTSLPLRRLPRRIMPTLVEVYSHRTIGRRDATVSWGHRAIVFGFTILFIGTVLVGINVDITRPLFGVDFLTGDFYLVYKLFLNVFGIAFLGGIVVMMWRRGVTRPAKLDYRPADARGLWSAKQARLYVIGDWTFVIALLFIGVTGYAVQGIRLAMDDPGYTWAQFGGIPFAALFDATLSEQGLANGRHVLWWVHGVAAVTWFASIPFTKASHMLTGFVNLALRDDRRGSVGPPTREESSTSASTATSSGRAHA